MKVECSPTYIGWIKLARSPNLHKYATTLTALIQ